MCWPCHCRPSCCCRAPSSKSRPKSWCANALPAAACCKASPLQNTLVLIERHVDGVPYSQEYSELLDQVRGCLCLILLLMATSEQEAGTNVHAVHFHPACQRINLASNTAVCEVTRQRSSPRAALSGSCWWRPSPSARTRPACARNAASTRCLAVSVISSMMSEPGKKGPAHECVDRSCHAETFELVYPEKGFRLVTEHVRLARALQPRSGSCSWIKEGPCLEKFCMCR